MNRRRFVATLAAATASAAIPSRRALAASAAARRTRWSIQVSEGFDALCFLSPLSGDEFYTRFYPAELAAFRPRLSAATLAEIAALKADASKQGSLLAPLLCLYFSGAPAGSLAALLTSLDDAEHRLQPALAASPYWSEVQWRWFLAVRPRLRSILQAFDEAGFSRFRQATLGQRSAARLAAARAFIEPLDVIAEQERLLGRPLEPAIEVNVLYFSKPHGTKILGQRFLTHIDYPFETMVRNAAHEMLHPPFDSRSAGMQKVLEVLGRDELLRRIVAEHDPRFGYTTLQGYLDEDTAQALEQIVSERLGVAKLARERWLAADGGMHVLAAGLYGLLKQDRFHETGGSIEQWLTAAASDRLGPPLLHTAAARVLGIPVGKLWPGGRSPRD